MKKELHRISLIKGQIILYAFILSMSGYSQDLNFTQFYAVPYQINPALTGAIDASYQVGLVYRDQWRGALENPLTTVAFGGEVKFDLNYQKTRGLTDRAGISLYFLSDKVTAFELNTNQIAVTAAYHKLLAEKTHQYLSFGAQFGVFQKNVNYDQLDFGDEFNNLDAFNLPTGESLPPNNFGFLDISLGINYTVKPVESTKIYMGTAFHHVTTPNVSFFNKEANINPTIFSDLTFERRLVVHFSLDQQISEYTSIQPRLLYQKQGVDTEYKVGANYRQAFTGFQNALYLGAWVSFVDNVDGLNVQALSPMLGFQLGSLILGFSYDINVQQTFSGTAGLNSFELSIRFLGNYYNDEGFCPVF